MNALTLHLMRRCFRCDVGRSCRTRSNDYSDETTTRRQESNSDESQRQRNTGRREEKLASRITISRFPWSRSKLLIQSYVTRREVHSQSNVLESCIWTERLIDSLDQIDVQRGWWRASLLDDSSCKHRGLASASWTVISTLLSKVTSTIIYSSREIFRTDR